MSVTRSSVSVLLKALAIAGLLAINYATPARAAFACWDCDNCVDNPDQACCYSGTHYTTCGGAGGGCSVGDNCNP